MPGTLAAVQHGLFPLHLLTASSRGHYDYLHSRVVERETRRHFRKKGARPLLIPGHDSYFPEKETEAEKESKSQTATQGQAPG